MKTIFQKHTSKFVAGLFNSLGIIACVSLTSCGDKNKGKQTDNQVEKLKNDLISTYSNLNEEDAKVIAEWLNNKNYGSDYKLNAKDLQEIFQNDSKLNEVVEKLGVKLTESDPKPDDEKQKEIQKWVTKLKSLENTDFNALDEVLQKKVAQKFIASGIEINDVTAIKEMLAGFINVVKEEKKQNEISIKIEKGGKVTITNVAGDTIGVFIVDTFENFKKFVDALNGKYITNEEVKLSFAFTGKNVKIGGHGTGFDITEYVVDFFKCFEDLIKIKGLNLKVSNLSLKISGSQLTLNGVDCSGEDFKKAKFWTLVKDHAAFFGITEKNKFEIEKEGDGTSAVVKIGGFKTELVWSEVVVSENTFKTNSKWGDIFKFKNEEKPVKTDVTVEFKEGKCFCYEIEGYERGVGLNDLVALKKLVGDLNGKTVKIGNSKNFSLAFDDKKVKVCGHSEGFDVMDGDGFATLLKYVAALKGEGKAISSTFKIALTMNGAKVLFGGVEINNDFVKTAGFWNTVKDNIGLFGISEKKIKVEKNNSDDQCKINESLVVGDLQFSVVCCEGTSVVKGYDQIFSLIAEKQN